MWKDLQFKGLCWHCHNWEISGSEHNLHYTQLFSPEQTRKRDWVTKHSHCSLQVSSDGMQVTTHSKQLGRGSELVDWYRDATSVPFGLLWIDLSPRTDDRFRYCANTVSIPPKFYNPDRLKQLKTLDDEHKKSPYSPSVLIIFPQMQKSFFQSRPKEFIRFLCECLINLLKRNLQSTS